MILYNDFLNDYIFRNVEKNGYMGIYAPLSEALYLSWIDYLDQCRPDFRLKYRSRTEWFSNTLNEMSEIMSEAGSFESGTVSLVNNANASFGYYSGAFGRYRAAKMLTEMKHVDGIVSVASTYENTGILVNNLQYGFRSVTRKPLLHLTFDGVKNDTDNTKLDSFLHFLSNNNGLI
jgi:hypothetical protein